MEFQTLNTAGIEETEDTVALFSFEDGIEERWDPFPNPSSHCCSYGFYRTAGMKPMEYDDINE